MIYRLLVGLLLVAGAALYCRGPSARTIVADTRLAVAEGTLEYRGRRYAAEWGEPVVHRGHLRRIERARYAFAPFITHHAVLTTGDFSDPERVTVGPFRGGSVLWSASSQPRGTLVVLHFIPRDAVALAELARLDDGDCAELGGREEVDGHIHGEEGAFARLNSSNHRYFLLEGGAPCR